MSTNKSTGTFKPRARLLLQLGDQLIRSENVAIVELIKNAYDADATVCDVKFRNIDQSDRGQIEIVDNGIGMTPEVVSRVWLEPGADFKDALLVGDQARLDFALTLPKRTPIGEKGVGRFGVHKLGDYIQLVTKSPDSSEEVVIEIDWSLFSQSVYLEDANFSVTTRSPKVFTQGKTGTSITIQKLRKTWDRSLYRELYKNILSLSSPIQNPDEFTVNVELNLKSQALASEWQKNLIKPEDIQKLALWRLDCVVEGSEIKKFDMQFTPLTGMEKVPARNVTIADLDSTTLRQKIGAKENVIDLDKYKIGSLRIHAYLFDLDTKVLKHAMTDPSLLKSYMAENGGVKVYRDNLRVYDYGEHDNDWLNLDKARINEPVKKIGNRNILGSVMLDRKSSSDLIEKTNREGFVDNDAAAAFRAAVGVVVDVFAQQRNIDKEHIRDTYENTPATQPVLHDIDDLKDTIEDRLSRADFDGKQDFKKEVFSGLDRIKDQYNETNRVLLKSAGAGLSLSVVIHEIDKRIKELVGVVSGKTLDATRVRSIVRGIARLVDNYSVLVANDRQKNVNLRKVVADAIFSSEFRFKAHNVEVITDFEGKEDIKVDCSVNIVIGAMLNIFDNAIYWLHTYGVENKKLWIGIRHRQSGEVSVVIADNGNGFKIAPEDAVRPFVTTRPGGIGLGLHIVNEMMKAHHGRLGFINFKEVDQDVPAEFSNGAILELIFKEK